jgi:FkbM family methyltransferase
LKSNYFQKLVVLNKSRKIFKNWNICAKLYLNQVKDTFTILETRTNKKIKIRSNTTDFMALANVWLLEDYKIKKFEIHSNDVIIDIGAHIGIFTIYASQFCNNGKIYSFEPVKENYDLLLNNIKLNHSEQVKPFNLAVSNTNDVVTIYINDDKAAHSIFPSSESSIKVKSITLQNIFEENNINHCNFLKLDCEGAEYEILCNLPAKYFKEIDKIVMECHFVDKKPELIGDLKQILVKQGFQVRTKTISNELVLLYAIKDSIILC